MFDVHLATAASLYTTGLGCDLIILSDETPVYMYIGIRKQKFDRFGRIKDTYQAIIHYPNHTPATQLHPL